MKEDYVEDTQSRGQIKSVDKAIDILQVLGPEKEGLQLNELARRLRINISTAHHLLDTLKQRGFVDQHKQTGAYLLSYNLIRLALTFLSKTDIYSASIDTIRELRDLSGETSYLSVLKNREIITLIELVGTRPVQARRVDLLGQMNLHATASGKLLLAHLPEEQCVALLSSFPLTKFTPYTITDLEELRKEMETIRKQGYAIDREEHILGVSCIDAPIFNYLGACQAAVSISYPTPTVERTDELLRLVIAAAAKISRNLGYISLMEEYRDIATLSRER